MTSNTPMRQSGGKPFQRAPGAPWRTESRYPIFEIFRGPVIAAVSDYSETYLREIAVGRAPVPDKLVDTMQEYTGWSVDRLFGSEFLKEWRDDHPGAE